MPTASLPVTINPNNASDVIRAQPICNPDGTTIASGGGAATIADGADIAEGAKADAAYTDVTVAAAGSLISLMKGLFKQTNGLGKVEDAASASGDTGIFTLGVRRDTLTVSASATGDYNEVAVDKYGSQQIKAYEKQARTYSAIANITVAASATDIAILPGSASTTVFVTKVIVSGVQTTGSQANVLLIKRSTANSGGTSAAMTAIPHDSGDSAAIAAPLSYTANPTPGTAVGTVRQAYVPVNAATAQTTGITVFDFGDRGKPITLNGVAQGVAVNLNGATLVAGAISVTFEWFEV